MPKLTLDQKKITNRINHILSEESYDLFQEFFLNFYNHFTNDCRTHSRELQCSHSKNFYKVTDYKYRKTFVDNEFYSHRVEFNAIKTEFPNAVRKVLFTSASFTLIKTFKKEPEEVLLSKNILEVMQYLITQIS